MFEEAAAVVVVVVETVGAAAAAEVVAVAVAAVVAAAESAAGVFDATVAVEVIETAAAEVLGVVEVLEVEAAAAAEAATSAAEPPRRPPPAGRKRPTSHSWELELACGQQRWQREQQLKVRTALRSTEVDEGQLPELMQQSPQVLELCRASAATPSPPLQFAVAPARWHCPAD